MKEIIVGSNEAGQRITKLLKKYLREASEGVIYKMLRKKNITLNQKKAVGKEILKEGDCIRLYLSEETLEKFQGYKAKSSTDKALKETKGGKAFPEREYLTAFHHLKGISVLFENNHIILVNKPRGILSQKAAEGDLSLNEWMIGYLLHTKQFTQRQLETFRPSICNRLDRNTSGLIICAKTYAGARQINQWIKNREIKKYYRCFITGELSENLSLKGFLKKDNSCNKVIISEKEREDFSPIETYIQPLCHGRNITYTEVELVTGKTHQIRAHLASINHPLLGDDKYGGPTCKSCIPNLSVPGGQLLHSYRIIFPVSEKYPDISGREFKAPEPAYFLKIKKELK